MVRLESSERGRREWLLTDGAGGYALGCFDGRARRKYHSYCTTAFQHPLRRINVLSFVEEQILTRQETITLFSHDTLSFEFIRGETNVTDVVRWRHDVLVEDRIHTIEKTLQLIPGGGCEISYSIEPPLRVGNRFRVRPVLAIRNHHRSHGIDVHVPPPPPPKRSDKGHWRVPTGIQDYPETTLSLNHPGAKIIAENKGFWLQYEWEAERGYPMDERIVSTFCFEVGHRTNDLTLRVEPFQRSLGPSTPQTHRYTSLRHELTCHDQADAPLLDWVEELERSARSFLVDGRRAPAILAGYPWLGIWARDTFISMPGLCLATKEYETARRILDHFAEGMSRGVIPNRIAIAPLAPGQSGINRDYTHGDGTLWFLYAAAQYVESTRDRSFLSEYLNIAEDVVNWYLQGTHGSIRTDHDALIYAGAYNIPLTWMHGQQGAHCMTQRAGKPIEINALWIAVLRRWATLAQRSLRNGLANRFNRIADQANASFLERYWIPHFQWFADVLETPSVDGYQDDYTLRPNQVIALSLPELKIPAELRRGALNAVRSNLLTPCGLRTLAPSDHRYASVYEGSVGTREWAMHNGVTWPWLAGRYLSALRLAYGKEEARGEQRQVLTKLKPFFSTNTQNHLAEMHDSELPFAARGCPAHALGIAEILRFLAEEYFVSTNQGTQHAFDDNQ